MSVWHNLNHLFYLPNLTFAPQKLKNEETCFLLFNDNVGIEYNGTASSSR